MIIAFAWLLTRAIVGAIERMPLADLAQTLGALALVVVVRATLLWLRDMVAARAASRVRAQLRANVITAIGSRGSGWLAQQNSAMLAVTAGRGLDALDAYFGRYLPQLVQTVIATPILIIVMWLADWVSGLTVLLTIPLIPAFMVLIGLVTRAVQRRQWQTLQHLAARFSDTVQGMLTLKIFGRQHRAASSIQTVTDRYRVETVRVLRVSFVSGFALEFLASISVAIIAVSIGFRLIDGSLVLLLGLFVLLLAPEAYLPIRQVGVQFHAAAEGVAATDEIFAVLDAAQVGPVEPSGLVGVEASADHAEARMLRIDALRVRVGDHALPPVSLEASPGTVTLIEGPSGAGKTSLLAALRGAAPFEGEARFGGADVRTLSASTWLAWAGQRPGLMAGTVGSNVSLGDPQPDAELIDRALELTVAGVTADRELGVQGAGLSGGQAQRVAVARACYRHLRGLGPVLALDEPSAALDAETEALLWRAVRRLADAGAIVLLVSHRTSARAIADQIVRLTPSEVPA